MDNAFLNFKYLDTIKQLGILSLCFFSVACSQPETPKEKVPLQTTENNKIELIQQDLITAQIGSAISKTPFSGTIRAINQSSVQTQVSATATHVTAQVGQKVQAGQVIIQLNNQDNAARLAQSRANLMSAQAQANQAQLMVQRKKRLYDQGFIAKVEYEQSQVDYKAQLENVKAQQANVDIAQKANQDGIIKSPISGVITKRQVEPGQTVAMGQTLFEIIDPDHLEIQAKLPVEQQNALKIGQKIEYTIQGNPQIFTARLSRISPIADLTSRQIDFYAQPEQSIPSLSIGAFIEGNILNNQHIDGFQIPLNSIQDLKNKPYVWLVRNHKIHKEAIDVLNQQPENNLAIVKGLQAGDLISQIKFSTQDINKTAVITQAQ